MSEHLRMPPRGKHRVLLDGVPMTREALVNALIAAGYAGQINDLLHRRFEFEGMYERDAMRLHNWCAEHGVVTSYR